MKWFVIGLRDPARECVRHAPRGTSFETAGREDTNIEWMAYARADRADSRKERSVFGQGRCRRSADTAVEIQSEPDTCATFVKVAWPWIVRDLCEIRSKPIERRVITPQAVQPICRGRAKSSTIVAACQCLACDGLDAFIKMSDHVRDPVGRDACVGVCRRENVVAIAKQLGGCVKRQTPGPTGVGAGGQERECAPAEPGMA